MLRVLAILLLPVGAFADGACAEEIAGAPYCVPKTVAQRYCRGLGAARSVREMGKNCLQSLRPGDRAEQCLGVFVKAGEQTAASNCDGGGIWSVSWAARSGKGGRSAAKGRNRPEGSEASQPALSTEAAADDADLVAEPEDPTNHEGRLAGVASDR